MKDAIWHHWVVTYKNVSKWMISLASLGYHVQKCLTRNDVMQHHWDVIYVIMDYISVYAVLLSFTFFPFSDEKSDFWVKLWFCMYMGVLTYYIIKKVEGGWLSNAYPCLKRWQNDYKREGGGGGSKIGQKVIT